MFKIKTEYEKAELEVAEIEEQIREVCVTVGDVLTLQELVELTDLIDRHNYAMTKLVRAGRKASKRGWLFG